MTPINLYPARPEDLVAIRRFHREQNERDGTSYPLPRFFNKDGNPSMAFPVSLVGKEDGSSEPLQAIWVERRAELMFAGCDPRATAFARRDIESLAAVLSWLGYNGVHCDVPIALAETIGKPLIKSGFERNDNRLAHFYRDTR